MQARGCKPFCTQHNTTARGLQQVHVLLVVLVGPYREHMDVRLPHGEGTLSVSRNSRMERVSREMRGTGVQNGGGSVARRIRGDFSERTPDNPPRYISRYRISIQTPCVLRILEQQNQNLQRQSGSGWSRRTRAAARGRAARQKNASKMEFLSIMFMWTDSILDANRCVSRKPVPWSN